MTHLQDESPNVTLPTSKLPEKTKALRGWCRHHTYHYGKQVLKTSNICKGCTAKHNASIFLCPGVCWQNFHEGLVHDEPNQIEEKETDEVEAEDVA